MGEGKGGATGWERRSAGAQSAGKWATAAPAAHPESDGGDRAASGGCARTGPGERESWGGRRRESGSCAHALAHAPTVTGRACCPPRHWTGAQRRPPRQPHRRMAGRMMARKGRGAAAGGLSRGGRGPGGSPPPERRARWSRSPAEEAGGD